MNYPTMEQVEAADREQLCRWWRFLKSPGASALNGDHALFLATTDRESKIANRLAQRFKEAGGFTPEISKRIGWDPQ